mgnify:CR=1 FL=1
MAKNTYIYFTPLIRYKKDNDKRYFYNSFPPYCDYLVEENRINYRNANGIRVMISIKAFLWAVFIPVFFWRDYRKITWVKR